MANFFHTLIIQISAFVAGAMLALTGAVHHAPQPRAQTASVAVAEQTGLSQPSTQNSASTSSIPAAINAPASSDSNPTIIYKYVSVPVETASAPNDTVTQSQLAATIQSVTAAFNNQLYGATSTFAGGGLWGALAASQRIDNLSNVTIVNPTISGLSANAIPDLSGSYLSTGGGTLSGAFNDLSIASSSFLGALGIGTTSPSDLFALNGAAYLADINAPSNTTNRLYANSGSLYWAGNLLGGAAIGNWTSDGTNVWRSGGSVGIGTSSPFAALSVNGNGYFSGNVTSLGSLTVSGTTTLGSVLSKPTSNYWLDSGPVNNVGIGGRLFVGPSYKNTGDKSTLGLYQKGVASWIDGEATMGYFDTRSQGEFISGQGRIGIAGVSRSSDNVDNNSGDNASIGVASYALNDSTSTALKASWAFYGHATQLNANAFTTAMELETNSYQPLVNVSPYAMGYAGTTAGMWLGVGGEDAAYVAAGNTYHGYTSANIQPVSVALGIINSVGSIANNVFSKGIVIQDGALLKDANGRSTWAQLADGQTLDWQYGGGASSTVGMMYSEAKGGSPNNQTRLVYAKTGFEIRGVNSNDYTQENKLLQLIAPTTSTTTDYFQLTPGVAGSNAITLAAAGGDANVNINLLPQGSGSVGIGNGTGGLTVSGNATTTGSSLIGGGLNIGNPGFAPISGGIYLQRTINPFISFVYGGTQVGQLRANAANQLSITDPTGNIPYLSVNTGGTSAGNVGIGSTTPGSLLSVGNTGGINFGLATSTFNTTGGINITAGCYAINGTCLSTGSGSGIAYPFALTGNATSTLTQFNGGLTAYASSTIGNGTQAGGLTVSGTATTSNLVLAADGQLTFTKSQYPANSVLINIASSTDSEPFLFATTTVHSLGIGLNALSNLNLSTLPNLFGNNNVAVGDQAGVAIGLGWSNVAIGYQALTGYTVSSNNSPNNNVAIGYQALYRATTAGSNICIGVSACLSVTTGTSNFGIGNSALLNVNTGIGNSALGLQALSVTGAASYNTAIGFRSGNGTNGSGVNGNLLIGPYTEAHTPTTSGDLNIGNILFGNGLNNALYAYAIASSTIGVGTTTPFARFSIQANNGDTNTTLFAIGSSTASATTTLFSVDNAGNVVIGGTSQIGSAHLGVNFNYAGTGVRGLALNDTSASAAAPFQVLLNNGTVIGSITGSGGTSVTYNTTSDRRVKENIATTTLGLDQLMQLPVRQFDFISDPTHAPTTGFIAQELYKVFPWAVTTNGDNGMVPLGATSTPWSVDYGRITPLIVKAVQDIANLSDTFKATLVAWFGNTSNGITDFFAGNIHAQNELCVGSTCVTPAQFQAMVAAANVSQGSGANSSTPSVQISAPTPLVISGTSTPPSINIQGSNPAIINVGDTYNDLGAIVHDNQGHDLSYRTFINGVLSENILISTSAAATDTIDYVATDTWGNISTSTRTVIVQAPQTRHASSTDNVASSTVQ